MNHILFYFFLSVSCGIFLDAFIIAIAPVFYATGAMCLILIAYFSKHLFRIFFLIVTVISVLLGGFLHATSSQRLVFDRWDQYLDREKNKEKTIAGIIDRDLKETMSFGKRRVSFVLTDVKLDGEHPRGKIKVYLRDYDVDLKYGMRLKLTGDLEKPGGQRNPSGFDEGKYLKTKNVFSILRAQAVEVQDAPFHGVRSFIYGVRNFLIRRMHSAFGEREANMAGALFLGERTGLERDVRDAFARTGAMHLFAISGLHVGLIGFMIHYLLSMMGLSARLKSIITIGVLVFYCLLTGGNPPVLRATLMASVYLAGRIFFRESNALNSLGLAGAMLLLWKPDQLLDAGFQLSFVAVAGLIIFVPRFIEKRDLTDMRSRNFLRFAFGQIRLLFIASLVAWIVTAPIVIHSFHRLYGLAPVVNVLLIPLVFLMEVILFVFAVYSVIPPVSDAIFSLLVTINMKIMMLVVQVFEGAPLFSLPLKSWAPWTWVLLGSGFLFIMKRQVLKNARIKLVAFVLIFANCLIFDQVVGMAGHSPLKVTFFDVGQGDSIFFQFPRGGNLLVDAGTGEPSDQGRLVIGPYLESEGIGRIDAILVTHSQFDHAGGVRSLMKRFDVGLILHNGRSSESSFYKKLEARIQKQGIRQVTVGRGMQLEGFEGAEVRFLHPDLQGPGYRDPNNRSVVTLITVYGKSFLLTGDIDEKGLDDLLQMRLNAHDFLKVPHHGSRLGPLGAEFLRYVNPPVAIIQVGLRNRYGHPHPETVDYVESVAENTYRTDRDGAIQVQIDEEGVLSVRTMLNTCPFGDSPRGNCPQRDRCSGMGC